MSARIFIHPRNSMSLADLVNQYVARGYVVRTTLRGNIEVRQVSRIVDINHYLRNTQCRQQ